IADSVAKVNLLTADCELQHLEARHVRTRFGIDSDVTGDRACIRLQLSLLSPSRAHPDMRGEPVATINSGCVGSRPCAGSNASRRRAVPELPPSMIQNPAGARASATASGRA
ncbi:MAG: hypothetical protein M5R42_21265, partial [Rhodocyclaceae bacterium]|nr:hypothetical protein [Rhodocyclaceae bacterium]